MNFLIANTVAAGDPGMQLVIWAVIVMTGLGLLLGLVIGIFAKYFRVADGDSRIELVLELLPGANCGGCGKPGCAEFARSVVYRENPPNRCPVSSQESVTAIALALGIEEGSSFARRAVVRCGGDLHHSSWLLNYNGVLDCASASLVSGGPKGCRYGCLGMGNCAHKCPFGAIEIVDHLAIVHAELCVGCGLCVAACPRNCITLIPASAHTHVFCNSPEKAVEKRKNCQVGCLGCRKCERTSPGKFVVEGSLARVNYDLPQDQLPNAGTVEATRCPTHALLTEEAHYRIGKLEEFHR